MYCTRHEWSFDRIVCTVSDILTPYDALEPDLCQYNITASNQCYPILLQVSKPNAIVGMGTACSMLWAPVSSFACVYMGLWSTRTPCLEQLLEHVGSAQANDMYSRDLFIVLRNGEWGNDDHLFADSDTEVTLSFWCQTSGSPFNVLLFIMWEPEHIHYEVVMHRLTSFHVQT